MAGNRRKITLTDGPVGKAVASLELEEDVDGIQTATFTFTDGSWFKVEQYDFEGMGHLTLDHGPADVPDDVPDDPREPIDDPRRLHRDVIRAIAEKAGIAEVDELVALAERKSISAAEMASLLAQAPALKHAFTPETGPNSPRSRLDAG